MKNATKNIVLSHLVILAAMTTGQAGAATVKEKQIDNSLNPTLIKKNTSPKPVKSNNKINALPEAPVQNTSLPATTNKRVNHPSVIPSIQPALQHEVGKNKAGIQKHNLKSQHQGLNGHKRLNPIEALNPAGKNTNNPTLTIPGKRGSRSSKGLNGSAQHSATGGSIGVVRDHRGGVSTFESMSGKRVMFPTPEGGTHQNPHSNGNFAEFSRVGDMYVVESDGAITYIPVGDVQNDPSPSHNNDNQNTSSSNNNSSNDSSNDSGDDSSNDSGDDSSNDSGDDSSNDSGDDSSNDSGTDDTDAEEGATENYGNTGPGGFNSNPSSSIAYCAANPYDSSCKQPESTQPRPCGEDDGSGRVAQPGPEGEGGCVPSIGNGDDNDDEDDTAPRAENNLPVSPTQSAEDRRNQVINPTGFEENGREDRNFAVETLEAIEQTVNPGDR